MAVVNETHDGTLDLTGTSPITRVSDDTPASPGGPDGGDHYLDRLYRQGMDRMLAKRQWACRERIKAIQLEEAANPCTFRPQLSKRASQISRPRDLSPENRAFDEVMRKKDRLARRRVEVAVDELSHCTFRPLTLNAAKMAAAELVRQPHLHSRLHDEAAERAMYRAEVEPGVLNVLERHVGDGPRMLRVSPEEIEDIVERLVYPQTTLDDEDMDSTGEFRHRPRVSAGSERIIAEKRRREGQPGDIVTRLTEDGGQGAKLRRAAAAAAPAPRERTRSAEAAERRHEIARDQHLRALFHSLAQEAANIDADGNAAAATRTLSFDEAAAMVVSTLQLGRAATRFLSRHEAGEVVGVLLRSELETMTMQQFMDFILFDARRTGPKLFMQPPQNARRQKANAEAMHQERRFRPMLSHQTQQMVAKKHHTQSIEARLIHAGKHKEEQRDKVRARRAKERDADEMEECTFAPKLDPTSQDLARYRKQQEREERKRWEEQRAAQSNGSAGIPEEPIPQRRDPNEGHTRSRPVRTDPTYRPRPQSAQPRRQAPQPAEQPLFTAVPSSSPAPQAAAHRTQRPGAAPATSRSARHAHVVSPDGYTEAAPAAQYYADDVDDDGTGEALHYVPAGRDVRPFESTIQERAVYGGDEALREYGTGAMQSSLVTRPL